MKNDKHGQIAVTFNWVYILIAGAVILLFFFGIVMKQKVSSEKTLTREVVDIMESIFTAAGVSEKTRNYIDMGGLRDEIFSFSCENAVSNFGMGEYNKENGIEPIFSPSEIRSRRFILWSLPYKLPFKVTDLLLQVPEPETIGVDRLCNIFAVKKDYNIPSIIVDFGTATTFDVINSEGIFIGGAIAAGIEISSEYLINKAALLSETNLVFPNNVIGIDTATNIQSGIMFGSVGQVEGMIHRIQEETEINYSIFLTGGFSKLISPKLKFNHVVDIDLTLKGIIYIYEHNNYKK